MKRSEIQIRDPFILAEHGNGYYLYGTTDKDCWGENAKGFDTYFSKDLKEWEGPFEAFTPPEGFWANKNFWAPEVYKYGGKYYMFASFKRNGVCRGTQVLVSDSPRGKFTPVTERPVTPSGWECLDGSLYIDDEGRPWMVFCHEWTQVRDGEICAMRLSDDLKEAIGEPVVLFKGSDAPWTNPFDSGGHKCYVTDGPFVYKTRGGKLLLLWSSFGRGGYALSVSRSESGHITGPWVHEDEPFYSENGGHGMIFKTFDGKIMLTIHAPNSTPNERAQFIELIEKDDELYVKRV